jgi:hypothetical protein
MRHALAILLSLAAAVIAARAPAAVLKGRVTGPGGTGVHPLDIDVRNSSTQALLDTPDDTTNAAGYYSVSVPQGRYDVTYKPTIASHLFSATRFNVQVADTTTIDLALSAGRLLTGRAVGTNGSGVAGAAVGFHDVASGDPAAQVQNHVTDAQGGFSTLVTPGTYDVQIVPTQASHKVPREFPDVVLEAVDQDLGTQTFASGFIVTGTITDQSLFPLTNADFDIQIAGESAKLFTPNDNTTTTGSASFVIPSGLYDISGNPPVGTPYAARTARSVTVAADMSLPNLALPPGVALTARCVNTGGTPIANVDCDADSLPTMRRLHTAHDATDALGNVSVQVSLYKFRVNYAPPVATKLLPVVFDSLQISGALNLGNVVHPAGHWVSVTVREQFTGMPLEGANLDFVDAVTGRTFLTIDDVTNASGFARVVTDQRLFTFVVRGPSPAFANFTRTSFRTLNDTAMVVNLGYDNTLGVAGATTGASLELSPAWPNPARGTVSATIVTSVHADVELDVLDLAGRRVATVFKGPVFGRHEVTWDTRDARGAEVAPGTYLMRLTDRRSTRTRRVTAIR